MNTPEAAARLVDAFPELAARIVVSITNGFDAADFAGPAPARTDDGAFRIVHTGTMHTSTGLRLRRRRRLRRLGGVTPGVDFLPRSHVVLLEALRRLGEPTPSSWPASRSTSPACSPRTTAASATPRPHARLLGYRSTSRRSRSSGPPTCSSCPCTTSRRAAAPGLVPGKTYEYPASGRPILAAVPDGDVRDFLGDAGTARFCRPADVGTMAAILRDELLRHRAGCPDRVLDRDAIAPYERRALTARLASVLDDVAGTTPAAALGHAA